MRIYQQMVDNEESDNSKDKKPKTEGNANESKSRPKRKPKSVENREENERKEKTNNDRSVEKTSDKSEGKDLNELREENKKLHQLVDQMKKETKSIINKAYDLNQKGKTSAMQTLELMKLNTYLILHLPDSERLLEEYLLKNTEKGVINDGKTASTSRVKDSAKSSSKAFKSPVVNPISNYFKSVDKTNSGNEINSNDNDMDSHKSSHSDTDSDDKPLINRMSSKHSSTKIKPKRNVSANENESNGRKNESTSRRVSPRKAQKRNNTESDTESVSKDQNESTVSRPSTSGYKSSSDTNIKDNKPKKKETTEKPKSKRKRRPRVEEPKGLFPCLFDPRQCDEIMDTKEHFDFHMSGHYDAKYVCPFCAYTGPTIQIIKRHLNKERESALQDAKEGKYLNADKRAHKDAKVYQCFGCKVCDVIHDKFEKRCEHIEEDDENQCDFRHDMDYEFKDHLKMHFDGKFKNIKDKDERKQKIKTIVDKFVEEKYFENNAKNKLLIEKFSKTKETEPKKISEDKERKMTTNQSSDSDWD